MDLHDAVARARAYVREGGARLGAGHGLLDHAVTLEPARLAALR
jgi:hydroxymethylpyrimidine/phosphomethylpyrimidine kinase